MRPIISINSGTTSRSITPTKGSVSGSSASATTSSVVNHHRRRSSSSAFGMIVDGVAPPSAAVINRTTEGTTESASATSTTSVVLTTNTTTPRRKTLSTTPLRRQSSSSRKKAISRNSTLSPLRMALSPRHSNHQLRTSSIMTVVVTKNPSFSSHNHKSASANNSSAMRSGAATTTSSTTTTPNRTGKIREKSNNDPSTVINNGTDENGGGDNNKNESEGTTTTTTVSVSQLKGWLTDFGQQNKQHYEKNQIKVPNVRNNARKKPASIIINDDRKDEKKEDFALDDEKTNSRNIDDFIDNTGSIDQDDVETEVEEEFAMIDCSDTFSTASSSITASSSLVSLAVSKLQQQAAGKDASIMNSPPKRIMMPLTSLSEPNQSEPPAAVVVQGPSFLARPTTGGVIKQVAPTPHSTPAKTNVSSSWKNSRATKDIEQQHASDDAVSIEPPVLKKCELPAAVAASSAAGTKQPQQRPCIPNVRRTFVSTSAATTSAARPSSSSSAAHKNPYEFLPKPTATKKQVAQKVQATDDTQASVQTLASWLKDKPFDSNKKASGPLRSGTRVIAKSRMFEDPKLLKDDPTLKAANIDVKDKKKWLENAFGGNKNGDKDSGSQRSLSSATTATKEKSATDEKEEETYAPSVKDVQHKFGGATPQRSSKNKTFRRSDSFSSAKQLIEDQQSLAVSKTQYETKPTTTTWAPVAATTGGGTCPSTPGRYKKTIVLNDTRGPAPRKKLSELP